MVAINGCSFSVLHNLMPYPADVLHAFLFYAIMGCMSIGSAGKSGKDSGRVFLGAEIQNIY